MKLSLPLLGFLKTCSCFSFASRVSDIPPFSYLFDFIIFPLFFHCSFASFDVVSRNVAHTHVELAV